MTGQPGVLRLLPSRASLLLAILVAGCTGAPLVASAPPFGLGTGTPPHPLPPAATAAPSASLIRAPTPRPSPTGTPALRLPAGVTVESREASYPITGDSAAALVEAMATRGLRDEAGDAAWALTTWDVVWNYQYVARQGGGCGLGDIRVSVRIEVLMPSWSAPATADGSLVDRWRRFIAAVSVHERGHVQNALDRAGEVATTLPLLDPAATCDALERVADADGAAIIDRGRAWDRDYDDETGHGATQGAVFP
jgi:predicted secreted Zn-dependent protease